MRHHKQQRKLGRVRKVRTGLLRSLARSLVMRGAITTTLSKAKEIRPIVEKLVTASKKDTVASRRRISAEMGNAEDVVAKLHNEIGPKYKERPGGYTRIIKLGRIGKATTESAKIEFV